MRRGPETGPIRRGLYRLLWLLMNGLFRVYFRMRVRGRPRPFPAGPLVVAANHTSYLDPLLLGLALPRRITYLVTSAVYERPFYRPWMWFFGAIKVQDGSVNVEAMRRALAVLRSGGVVGIFPEGGISDDQRLQEGQIGVASLLLQGGAPVLTAGLVGTHQALPRGSALPRPARVEVNFSDFVRPDQLDAALAPRVARRELRDRVMAAIARGLPETMQPRST
jgi:1-acyl-sn-glycerol-3-phosphate acyltransferase